MVIPFFFVSLTSAPGTPVGLGIGQADLQGPTTWPILAWPV